MAVPAIDGTQLALEGHPGRRVSEADQTELDFSAAEEADNALIVALDAFDGPLHLLLELARARKVDLTRVPIAEIADQYLAFIDSARADNMELAGDYLVMAAWLALLKSRLLIPKQRIEDDEPSPDDLAAALRLKLLRLQQARANAELLRALPQLNSDFFVNAAPQPFAVTRKTKWQAEIYDLLSSYCADRTRTLRRVHRPRPRQAYPLAEARKRLERILDEIRDWRPIQEVTPKGDIGPEAPPPASYLASMLGASLELAREGKVEMRQAEAFAPLFLRSRPKAQP